MGRLRVCRKPWATDQRKMGAAMRPRYLRAVWRARRMAGAAALSGKKASQRNSWTGLAKEAIRWSRSMEAKAMSLRAV